MSTALLTVGYSYGTTGNNGNVQTQTITRLNDAGGQQTWTQSYGYSDGVNRLTCANEVAPAHRYAAGPCSDRHAGSGGQAYVVRSGREPGGDVLFYAESFGADEYFAVFGIDERD